MYILLKKVLETLHNLSFIYSWMLQTLRALFYNVPYKTPADTVYEQENFDIQQFLTYKARYRIILKSHSHKDDNDAMTN